MSKLENLGKILSFCQKDSGLLDGIAWSFLNQMPFFLTNLLHTDQYGLCLSHRRMT